MSEKPSSRLSASVVAVFHEVCIVEEGMHEELLRKHEGRYTALRNAQAQYYKENGICVS